MFTPSVCVMNYPGQELEMRIFITGAGGFIGSHIVRRLCREHQLVVGVHSTATAGQLPVGVEWLAVDFSVERAVEDWVPLLQGIDVVINTVGIIVETRAQRFEQVHFRAPCSLFQACERAGVGKVIQLSALGADDAATSRFHVSKKAADDCLRALDLDWVVLRPSLVFGRGGGSASLFAALAVLPRTVLIGGGEQELQPVSIDDLCAAMVALLAAGAPARVTIDVVGPQLVSYAAMLASYRTWLGLDAARVVQVPPRLALAVAAVNVRCGAVLAGPSLNPETLQMLERGSSGDAAALSGLLGRQPVAISSALMSHPAVQADRWHARLFFLRPLLRVSIGLLWLFTGLLSLGLYPTAQSYALLAQLGIIGPLACLALYGAALLDVGLGVATLARWRIQWLGIAQIALMLGYTLLISIGLTELWLHPFGPISKNIPLMVATLVMLALEHD